MEQAETVIEPTTPEGIGDIYTDALKENQPTPKDGIEDGQEQVTEQPLETPFLELLLDEKNKVPFKNEDEFISFLERNKVLKDGWLRQADYTRKTQAISEKEKQFEKLTEEEQQLWGKVAPDPASKKALTNVWQVFQSVQDPSIAEKIEKFVADVNLIAQGKTPVGPLMQAGVNTGNPEIDSLKNEVLTLKNELKGYQNNITQKERETLARQEAEQTQKLEKEIDSWIADKEKETKSAFPGEVLMEMSKIMAALDEKGQPYFTLDQAHEMARTRLGLTVADAAKRVFKDAKQASSKTPRAPISKGSSTDEPEAKSIGDIYEQGARKLSA